jgi:hypothetical protein
LSSLSVIIRYLPGIISYWCFVLVESLRSNNSYCSLSLFFFFGAVLLVWLHSDTGQSLS